MWLRRVLLSTLLSLVSLVSLGVGCGVVVPGEPRDASVHATDAGHDALVGAMDVHVPPVPEATVVDSPSEDVSVACSATNPCPGTQTICVKGACVACGNVGDPCCGGDSCGSAASVCLSGQCAPCGGIGQDCCALSSCSSATTLCSHNQCEACGQVGDPCCAGNRCYSANGTVACISDECVVCGYPGSPCCDDSTCYSGCCNTASQCTMAGC